MVSLTGFLLFIPAISLAVLWQKSLGPLIRSGGVFRQVEPLRNENCRTIPELDGCESMTILHVCILLRTLRADRPSHIHRDGPRPQNEPSLLGMLPCCCSALLVALSRSPQRIQKGNGRLRRNL